MSDYIDKFNVSGVNFPIKDAETSSALETEIATRASETSALDSRVTNTVEKIYDAIDEKTEGHVSTDMDLRVVANESRIIELDNEVKKAVWVDEVVDTEYDAQADGHPLAELKQRVTDDEETHTQDVEDLQTKISSEIARATSAEQANTSSISDEATRAMSAEQTNATAISSETTRAKGIESGLDTRLSNMETSNICYYEITNTITE